MLWKLRPRISSVKGLRDVNSQAIEFSFYEKSRRYAAGEVASGAPRSLAAARLRHVGRRTVN